MKAAANDYPEFQRLDQRFHSQVMKASGNEVGRTIVRVIHQYGGARPMLNSPAPEDALKRTVAAHEGILAALVARDPELAASRIADHIDSAWAERRIGR